LGDDIAGSAVPLQLEDMDSAFAINGEKVDEAAVISPHLPPDKQQLLTHKAWVGHDVVLQLGLQPYTRGREAGQLASVSTPKAHLQRHVDLSPIVMLSICYTCRPTPTSSFPGVKLSPAFRAATIAR